MASMPQRTLSTPVRAPRQMAEPASQPTTYQKLPELEDLPPVAGRRVLVRCDFNVPLRRDRVVDDLRIRAATPTLEWLVRRGAHVTVCTHLGRPGGRRDPRFDLAPVRDRLHELVPDVELMDNLRFHAGEVGNDPCFVDRLVEGQDFYVNDAFATAHREHASVVGPPSRLPSAAGRLLSREVAVLTALRQRARHPFVAILGGEPDPEKMSGLRRLMEFVDTVVLGGPVAFEVMSGAGSGSGYSYAEEWSDLIRAGRLILPPDVVIGREDDTTETGLSSEVPPGWRALDFGHRSAARISNIVAAAGTVFWDGAMSANGYVSGTRLVAEAVAAAPAFTVVSGIDTLEAVSRLRLSAFIDHTSTGSAASLAFLRDGDLPGLRAIRQPAPHPL